MKKILFITSCWCLLSGLAGAQVLDQIRDRVGNAGRQMQQGNQGEQGASDSLIVPKKRPVINIKMHYRYLDDVVDHTIDSSINDFTRYIPLPADYVLLGNMGTPARGLIFNPGMHAGFDAGFHAFDAYRFWLDSTRFFNTTRPFTRLKYMIGSKQEQLIEVFHTQNPKPNFNFGFHFRKVNAPGFFQNQNTDDNSYNIFAHYNGKDKRYHAYLSFVGNKMNAGENGGLKNDEDLENPSYSDRRTIPVRLGGSNPFSGGFFTAPVATKSNLKESSWLFNQHYDWGSGDTVKINDTTFNYEFHPVFRIEHTLKLTHTSSGFTDTLPYTASSYYFDHYGLDSLWTEKLTALHDWKNLSNDLSVVQFPSKESETHFLKAGAAFEYIQGHFLENSISFYNIKGHFEYHNLTKNKKWDLDAYGELYLAGNNFGDYRATASLSRYLNEKLGNITLSATNLNQTPSFIYRFFQSNRFLSTNTGLKKTNITKLQFKADNAHLKYHLAVNYYLMTNYTYFKDYMTSAQDAAAFNLLQIILNKQFTLGHFNWYVDLALQQAAGSPPLHLPRLWTRNRLSYENTLFKNLILCTGLEGIYNTAYYADDYSPVIQQFIVQDKVKLNNPLPAVAAFVNFRIKSFVAYIRGENLNTFAEPNIMQVPHYPYPGFTIRVGISWDYID